MWHTTAVISPTRSVSSVQERARAAEARAERAEEDARAAQVSNDVSHKDLVSEQLRVTVKWGRAPRRYPPTRAARGPRIVDSSYSSL